MSAAVKFVISFLSVMHGVSDFMGFKINKIIMRHDLDKCHPNEFLEPLHRADIVGTVVSNQLYRLLQCATSSRWYYRRSREHFSFVSHRETIFHRAGFICMDCSVLARCVFRNNGWDTIPLEVCDAGQNLYCHANEQRCSSSPGPCNPGAGQGGGNFACTSAGSLWKI